MNDVLNPQREWEVMLNGDSNDLRHISEFGISTDYFRVWGGIDDWHDCRNDHFSFNSLYFEGEEDMEMVWQVAYELLSLFNGASELYERCYRKLTIHGIHLRDKPLFYSEQLVAQGLLGRPLISRKRRDDEMKKAKKGGSRLALLVLATENDDVYMILKYLDLGRGWADYYKLMETIDSHAAIKSITVSDNQSTRKSFTNTANNFSLARFDSRHGFKQMVKQNKTPAMTIEDAHRYVTALARSYLTAAYPQHFVAR